MPALVSAAAVARPPIPPPTTAAVSPVPVCTTALFHRRIKGISPHPSLRRCVSLGSLIILQRRIDFHLVLAAGWLPGVGFKHRHSRRSDGQCSAALSVSTR